MSPSISRYSDDVKFVSCCPAYLRTVDSDVVVLAIYLHVFGNMGLSELWIGFGVGNTYKDISIQHITKMLGLRRCEAQFCPRIHRM